MCNVERLFKLSLSSWSLNPLLIKTLREKVQVVSPSFSFKDLLEVWQGSFQVVAFTWDWRAALQGEQSSTAPPKATKTVGLLKSITTPYWNLSKFKALLLTLVQLQYGTEESRQGHFTLDFTAVLRPDSQAEPFEITFCNGLHITGPFIHSPHTLSFWGEQMFTLNSFWPQLNQHIHNVWVSLCNGAVRNISSPGFKSILTSIDPRQALKKMAVYCINRQPTHICLT